MGKECKRNSLWASFYSLSSLSHCIVNACFYYFLLHVRFFFSSSSLSLSTAHAFFCFSISHAFWISISHAFSFFFHCACFFSLSLFLLHVPSFLSFCFAHAFFSFSFYCACFLLFCYFSCFPFLFSIAHASLSNAHTFFSFFYCTCFLHFLFLLRMLTSFFLFLFRMLSFSFYCACSLFLFVLRVLSFLSLSTAHAFFFFFYCACFFFSFFYYHAFFFLCLMRMQGSLLYMGMLSFLSSSITHSSFSISFRFECLFLSFYCTWNVSYNTCQIKKNIIVYQVHCLYQGSEVRAKVWVHFDPLLLGRQVDFLFQYLISSQRVQMFNLTMLTSLYKFHT